MHPPHMHHHDGADIPNGLPVDSLTASGFIHPFMMHTHGHQTTLAVPAAIAAHAPLPWRRHQLVTGLPGQLLSTWRPWPQPGWGSS